MISLSRGDVAAADEAVSFALPLVEAHGDERNTRNIRALAGLIAFRRGDQDEAERTCRAAATGAVDVGTDPDTPFALEALGLVLAGRRQAATDLAAVRLLAAASSLRAETHSFACAEVLPFVDRALQNLRGRLGDVAFDNACIAGKALPLGTLLDEQVGVVETPIEDAADSRSEQERSDALLESALTAREREVVALVAEGMTNRQIASSLQISEWTAINHVRHAMRKLGVPSRVHVAQWATRHRLRQHSSR
jgi:non-specific serine/threonine protein kinase